MLPRLVEKMDAGLIGKLKLFSVPAGFSNTTIGIIGTEPLKRLSFHIHQND
jgi:ATP/maltotriose-dependent transcriptional regulator MalT